MTITITGLRTESGSDGSVSTPTPRLSWVVNGPAGWAPSWTEVELDEQTVKLGVESVLVSWPFDAILPRNIHGLRVRAGDEHGEVSEWSDTLQLFGAFLGEDEWRASLIGLPGGDAKHRPGLVRKEFEVRPSLIQAILYGTAHGVYQAEINGIEVDDGVLKPGWTAYQFRLAHETTDVTHLMATGPNVLGATFAGGWYTEIYLGQSTPFYGDTPAVALQLRLDYSDGSHDWVRSGDGWTASTGPITASGIYNGEDYDANLEQEGWSQPGFDDRDWAPVRIETVTYPTPSARVSPPVRETERLAVKETIESASGFSILDFGQNLVGRLKVRLDGPAGAVVTLRHAEVLEDGELATRPLREARATDTYTLRGTGNEVWEPRFTFHGFRYAQITGVDILPDAVVAVVIGSDMKRTGWFSSSNPLLNRLHENVVWGMRGNFLSVPTDCPQRNERLGWTGDLQVFAPTASFLFDTESFLTSWLEDLNLEQQAVDGIVPFVIPDPLPDGKRPTAAWGDVATVVPTVLYERYGDLGILRRQLPSMTAWADVLLARAGTSMLWRGDFQFGDWLDPAAPAENPFGARTDPDLIATAHLYKSVRLVARASAILGDHVAAEKYDGFANQIHATFGNEFLSPSGRMSSDAPTAYAVGIRFGLYANRAQFEGMGKRLADLVRADGYRIATGFVGTPVVADALTDTGHIYEAERLLLQTESPSWLYPVTMGATTIWERWDSMLEDGTVNSGEMTSFNHYALGAVADWLHRVVAGLSPIEPGYRTLLIAPKPLDRLESAEAILDSPYGRIRLLWEKQGSTLHVEATIPTGASAIVELPGRERFEVLSGDHVWNVDSARPDPRRAEHLDWMTTPLSEIIDDEEAYDVIRRVAADINPELAARFRRQIKWTHGFTLDETMRGLGREGRAHIEQALDLLNARE